MRLGAVIYLKASSLFTLAWLLASSPAAAQDAGNFYLDRVQLSGAPDDPFMTWRPYMGDQTRFFGSATLGYGLNTLRIGALTNEQSIIDDYAHPFEHQVIAYLGGGIQISKRVALDVMQPIALVGVGTEPSEVDVGRGLARGAAVHDTRVGLRFMGIESDDKKFRWGGGGALFFPTGNVVRFSSDNETTSWIFTNVEVHFDDMMFVAMAGPQFRPRQGPAGSILQVGNELRTSVGLFMPFYDERTTLGLEIWGQTGIDEVTEFDTDNIPQKTESSIFRPENTSFEWLLQARRDMGAKKEPKRWFVQAGGGTRLAPGYGAADVRLLMQIGAYVPLSDLEPAAENKPRRSGDNTPLDSDPDTDGDGFPDSIDQCVTIKEDGAEPYPDDGCPDVDKDKDGILDVDDKCPLVPEDKDGIEDEDGCPEDDADKDGILDVDDACPLVPGVKQKDPKKNGCPKAKKIVVTNDAVKLLEPIQFAYNEARILPESFELLDEVYDLMKSRPGMKLGIYGHTDNQGSASYNKNLSTRRAASVVKYLVDKGIAPELLESEGFGLEQPIAPNDTEAGRAKNRRVEFKILQQ